MYELLCRSAERPWVAEPERHNFSAGTNRPSPLILQTRAGRTNRRLDVRDSISMIVLRFIAACIASADRRSLQATTALSEDQWRPAKANPSLLKFRVSRGNL
jgi:hypothetical protein